MISRVLFLAEGRKRDREIARNVDFTTAQVIQVCLVFQILLSTLLGSRCHGTARIYAPTGLSSHRSREILENGELDA